MDNLRAFSDYSPPEPMSLNSLLDETQRSTIATLARFRFAVLNRASALLEGPPVSTEVAEAYQDVLRLLMTSLEGLKLAEEELRAQNAELIERQALIDDRTRHYRELFLRAPAPILITDLLGTIHEANIGAANLLKREAHFLERKPLAALIHPGHSTEFRKQFARFSAQEGARDWRIWINRHGDVPIEVRATVTRLDGLGPAGSGVLCWMFDDGARVALGEP